MTPPDSPIQTLYDSADFATVGTVVTAGAGVIIAIVVTMVGIKIVKRLLNRA